jgi:hypothetical protein
MTSTQKEEVTPQTQEANASLNPETTPSSTQSSSGQTTESTEVQKGKKEVKMSEFLEQAESEAATLEYLNDYEGLLKYTLKLLEDNKMLMKENIKVKMEEEEMLLLQTKLEKENDVLKRERETLMRDTLVLLEYNDELQASKDRLEDDLMDIKSKFETILIGLKGLDQLDDDSEPSTANTTMETRE